MIIHFLKKYEIYFNDFASSHKLHCRGFEIDGFVAKRVLSHVEVDIRIFSQDLVKNVVKNSISERLR